MKFSLKVIVVVLIAFSLALSACGGSPTDETKPEVRVNNTPDNTPTPEPMLSVPAEISGEVVYVPFPVKITVDGDL